MFGVNTGYHTPSLRSMLVSTSALSPICRYRQTCAALVSPCDSLQDNTRNEPTCGTHFGDTNDVASIADSPVCESKLISFTLFSVEISVFSFCSPSRGPTSTILTCDGYEIACGATTEKDRVAVLAELFIQ